MSDFDLISTYFPTAAEITTEQRQSMRERLEAYGKILFPDLDMRPDSVFGMWYLNAFTEFMTALEEAMRRQRSDADLSQVEQGIIYDCAFVEKFLHNWAVQDRAVKQASGTIRLTFSQDATTEVDLGTKFSFGTSGDMVFLPRAIYTGPIEILPVGSSKTAGRNQMVLQQVDENDYAVDIPVLGYMSTPVVKGLAAALDRTIENLISAVSLYDFVDGAPAMSLSKLASLARRTSYAVGMGSRGQIAQMLTQNFPEALRCSAVMSDDPESMRGGVNPLGIQQGAVDLYVKSGTYQFFDTTVLRVPYVVEQDGTPVGKFMLKLGLLQAPIKIEKLTHLDTALNLEYEILVKSKDPVRAPLLTAGFTRLEDMWLVIDMPKDSSGSDLVPLLLDQDGAYAMFQLDFWTDPLISSASDFVDGPEAVAENVDLVVRGFLPITFTKFNVRYIRDAATLTALEAARERIHQYINELAYPDVFSLAEIAEIMRYSGARSILGVDVSASVPFTIGTRVLKVAAPDPLEDYAGAITESFEPYGITIRDVGALQQIYRDPNAGTASEQLFAIGPRNIGFWLHPDTITFTEDAAR